MILIKSSTASRKSEDDNDSEGGAETEGVEPVREARDVIGRAVINAVKSLDLLVVATAALGWGIKEIREGRRAIHGHLQPESQSVRQPETQANLRRYSRCIE